MGDAVWPEHVNDHKCQLHGLKAALLLGSEPAAQHTMSAVTTCTLKYFAISVNCHRCGSKLTDRRMSSRIGLGLGARASIRGNVYSQTHPSLLVFAFHCDLAPLCGGVAAASCLLQLYLLHLHTHHTATQTGSCSPVRCNKSQL